MREHDIKKGAWWLPNPPTQSALAWDQLLFSELGNEEFTLDRIYQIYCQFHTLETTPLVYCQ